MTKGSKKSIIFVLGGLSGGGAERVAAHLINYWHQTGRNIVLVVRRGPEDDFYSIPDHLKRYHLGGEGPSGNKLIALFKNIPFVWRLRRAVKQEKAPIVISFLTKTNIHTLLACIGLGKKVIISERNDTTRELHPWPWPALRKLLYRFAKVVTANSDIALKGMKNYVPEKKLSLVPNPVYIPSNRAKPAQSNIILNVGRLVRQKNQQLIIEALSVLDKSVLNGWSVEILGEGEEEKNLAKRAVELNVEKHVILHGKVKEISEYYLRAGIFVLSSFYEGTPNALLEAMSYGLPPVVSDKLPGALEIIEDGKSGLIFSSEDATDLAEKLKVLMANPEMRSEIGNNAKVSVKKFAPEKVMPVWDKLIKNA